MAYPMVMQEKLNDAFQKAGMNESDIREFASSEPFGIAIQSYLNSRAEKFANGRAGGVSKVVQEVEFSAYPFTDASGHCIDYKCAFCGTKAKVRTMKRVRGKKASGEAKQENIPGVEVEKLWRSERKLQTLPWAPRTSRCGRSLSRPLAPKRSWRGITGSSDTSPPRR